MSPGVKRGGWVNLVQRTVSVSCPGDAVLPSIEVCSPSRQALYSTAILMSICDAYLKSATDCQPERNGTVVAE